jgi:ribA/ribD-fused uncharacterized protein
MTQAQVDSIYKVTDIAIQGFFMEHRFLSNFHICDIEYEGLTYPSSEAAYQAAKSLDPTVRVTFTTMVPSKAKSKGQTIKLRPDWEKVKFQVMLDINRIKYHSHPDLAVMLSNTGDKYLEETNYWKDSTYGTYNGKGKNMLGHILMQVRKELGSVARFGEVLLEPR